MEIREFVEKALSDVLEGVRAVQRKQGGSDVNAAIHLSGDQPGGNMFVSTVGTFTRVDFDLAVTAETTDTTEGGGKLSVVGIGVSGNKGTEVSTQSVSRVAFSVPVRLPEGDQSKIQELYHRL